LAIRNDSRKKNSKEESWDIKVKLGRVKQTRQRERTQKKSYTNERITQEFQLPNNKNSRKKSKESRET